LDSRENRGNAEQCAAQAVGAAEDDLIAMHHQDDGAGQIAALDGRFHDAVDAVESLSRNANVFRFRDRRGLSE
jgi:hypothetical protein